MSESKALKDFRNSLKLAEELMKLERNYSNPPKQNEMLAVLGLRGGASVLMVAGFEYFIRQTIEYHLSEVSPLKISFEHLPDKMKIQNTFMSLEYAMKGKPFQPSKNKIDRLNDIDITCRRILSGTVDPEVFSNTGGNPSSKTVREMFKNLGMNDIFTSIKSNFCSKWGKPIASTYIEDKLDEIVNRRHIVAHTADALNIGRSDLRESLKFLRILAELIDKEIHKFVLAIINEK